MIDLVNLTRHIFINFDQILKNANICHLALSHCSWHRITLSPFFSCLHCLHSFNCQSYIYYDPGLQCERSNSQRHILMQTIHDAFSILTFVCCSTRTGSYWGRCQRMLTPKLLEISSRVWTRRRTSIQETTTTRKFYKSTENLKDGVGWKTPLLHSAQKGESHNLFNVLLLITILWNSFSLALVSNI